MNLTMNKSLKYVSGFVLFAVLAVAATLMLPPGGEPAHAAGANVNIFTNTYSASALDLSDAAGATLTVAAPGAILGDACIASLSEDAVDATMTCYVQAANAIEVRFQNESGTSTNLAGGTVRVFHFQRGTR